MKLKHGRLLMVLIILLLSITSFSVIPTVAIIGNDFIGEWEYISKEEIFTGAEMAGTHTFSFSEPNQVTYHFKYEFSDDSEYIEQATFEGEYAVEGEGALKLNLISNDYFTANNEKVEDNSYKVNAKCLFYFSEDKLVLINESSDYWLPGLEIDIPTEFTRLSSSIETQEEFVDEILVQNESADFDIDTKSVARVVFAVAGSDRNSNNNAFLNNINTFKKDNPNDAVYIFTAWSYNGEKALMNDLIWISKDKGGIDVLLIESHGDTGNSTELVVTGGWSLKKTASWGSITFNAGANIRFTGCYAGGYETASANSIAQHVANATQRTVWAYVNSSSQIAYDRNGRITNDWRQAVSYYQQPVVKYYNQPVVNSYTKFMPVPPKPWWNFW